MRYSFFFSFFFFWVLGFKEKGFPRKLDSKKEPKVEVKSKTKRNVASVTHLQLCGQHSCQMVPFFFLALPHYFSFLQVASLIIFLFFKLILFFDLSCLVIEKMREKGFGFRREAVCNTYRKKKEERKKKLVLTPFA